MWEVESVCICRACVKHHTYLGFLLEELLADDPLPAGGGGAGPLPLAADLAVNPGGGLTGAA